MKILVADDHPLYREAAATQLRRLYPHAVVDEAASLAAVVQDGEGGYDLFLVDFHMPGVSVEAIGKLAARFPGTPVAVISGTADRDDVRAAIAAGARGFVPKTATADQFSSAIAMLLAGGTSVPVEFLRPDSEVREGEPPWLASLSPRELQVLKAVARGISNKEIARELDLAEVTVKLHLSAVFRKMGAHSRAEAAVLATKAGIA